MSETAGIQQELERPSGPLETRDAKIANISFPQRLVEVIVMPYEQEALVEHRGRMIREVIARGAFDGIQRRPNKIKANRDHDVTRSVGHMKSLHPSREEGLVGEVYISRTEAGNETLELLDDGTLGASAGFLPLDRPGAEKWETRSLRRIVKAWLGHVAFVAEPAYDGAQVLSVRQKPDESLAEVFTPNLDKLRADMMRERYERLSRAL